MIRLAYCNLKSLKQWPLGISIITQVFLSPFPTNAANEIKQKMTTITQHKNHKIVYFHLPIRTNMRGENYSFLRTLPMTQIYYIRWPPFHGSVKKSVHSTLVTVARGEISAKQNRNLENIMCQFCICLRREL